MSGWCGVVVPWCAGGADGVVLVWWCGGVLTVELCVVMVVVWWRDGCWCVWWNCLSRQEKERTLWHLVWCELTLALKSSRRKRTNSRARPRTATNHQNNRIFHRASGPGLLKRKTNVASWEQQITNDSFCCSRELSNFYVSSCRFGRFSFK